MYKLRFRCGGGRYDDVTLDDFDGFLAVLADDRPPHVLAYICRPPTCLRLVPSSGRCEGAHKKVLIKTAPLSRIARSTHSCRMAYHGRVERGCKLLRGIWGIETFIYKTAGKSSSSPCSLRAASLEKFTGSFHCGNYTLECSYVESFRF